MAEDLAPDLYSQMLRQSANRRGARGSVAGAGEAAGVIGKGMLTDIGAGWQGIIGTAGALRRGAPWADALRAGAQSVEGVREHYAPKEISAPAQAKLGRLQGDIEQAENAINRAGWYDLSKGAPGLAAIAAAGANVIGGPKKPRPTGVPIRLTEMSPGYWGVEHPSQGFLGAVHAPDIARAEQLAEQYFGARFGRPQTEPQPAVPPLRREDVPAGPPESEALRAGARPEGIPGSTIHRRWIRRLVDDMQGMTPEAQEQHIQGAWLSDDERTQVRAALEQQRSAAPASQTEWEAANAALQRRIAAEGGGESDLTARATPEHAQALRVPGETQDFHATAERIAGRTLTPEGVANMRRYGEERGIPFEDAVRYITEQDQPSVGEQIVSRVEEARQQPDPAPAAFAEAKREAYAEALREPEMDKIRESRAAREFGGPKYDRDIAEQNVEAFLGEASKNPELFLYGLAPPKSLYDMEDLARHYSQKSGERIRVDAEYADPDVPYERPREHSRGEVMRDRYGEYKVEEHGVGEEMFDDEGNLKTERIEEELVGPPDRAAHEEARDFFGYNGQPLVPRLMGEEDVPILSRGGEYMREEGTGEPVWRLSEGGEPVRDERGRVKMEENPDYYDAPQQDEFTLSIPSKRSRITYNPGEGSITATGSKAGSGAGQLLYQLANSYAVRNNLTIGGTSLTDINRLRLLGNALSTYARHGENPRDVSGAASGGRPTSRRSREPAGGFELLNRETGEVEARLKGEGVNPRPVEFTGDDFIIGGEPVSAKDIEAKLDIISPNWKETGVGVKTLQRAAVMRYLEQASPEEAARLAQQWSKKLGPIFAGVAGLSVLSEALRGEGEEFQ